jgi:hypothetical protein
MGSDHCNPGKNQQEETLSQRGEKRHCKYRPWKKRNGNTPLGYSGRTALRREQCDEMYQSRITAVEARRPLPANGSMSTVLTAT